MTLVYLNLVALRLSARRRRLGVPPHLVKPGVYFPRIADSEYQPCCDRVSGNHNLTCAQLYPHLMSFEHCRYRAYAHLINRLSRRIGFTHDHA